MNKFAQVDGAGTEALTHRIRWNPITLKTLMQETRIESEKKKIKIATIFNLPLSVTNHWNIAIYKNNSV